MISSKGNSNGSDLRRTSSAVIGNDPKFRSVSQNKNNKNQNNVEFDDNKS